MIAKLDSLLQNDIAGAGLGALGGVALWVAGYFGVVPESQVLAAEALGSALLAFAMAALVRAGAPKRDGRREAASDDSGSAE